MPDVRQLIADNLSRVRDRIHAAANRANRRPEEITLVAVTKYVDEVVARALVDEDAIVLGESRPQELWRKVAALNDKRVQWHLIGHLQRNKARRTLPLLSLFHAADSLRLLKALDEEAARSDIKVPLLLEVNVSGDAEKHGFAPDHVESALAVAAELQHTVVRGLMGMAARGTTPAEARRDFACLRNIRDRVRPACPAHVQLDELSMGMSNDFDVAIEEGATIVRVGSSLFSGVHA